MISSGIILSFGKITLPDNLNLKSEVDDWVKFVKDYLEKELELE